MLEGMTIRRHYSLCLEWVKRWCPFKHVNRPHKYVFDGMDTNCQRNTPTSCEKLPIREADIDKGGGISILMSMVLYRMSNKLIQMSLPPTIHETNITIPDPMNIIFWLIN